MIYRKHCRISLHDCQVVMRLTGTDYQALCGVDITEALHWWAWLLRTKSWPFLVNVKANMSAVFTLMSEMARDIKFRTEREHMW